MDSQIFFIHQEVDLFTHRNGSIYRIVGWIQYPAWAGGPVETYPVVANVIHDLAHSKPEVLPAVPIPIFRSSAQARDSLEEIR